jgi:23S rRNA (uridine2552-2'-O)-methyltransferase
MSKRWLSERKRDYYYRKAKQDNYRSRAAYKLIQINEKFPVLRPEDIVIDLGASPGGWSQVAAEIAGEEGLVIAIDIKPVSDIPGVKFLKGDARSEEIISEVKKLLGEKKASVIISDMSPNISGNYSVDHALSIELAGIALEYALMFLKKRGNMLVKVFDGELANEYFRRMKNMFWSAKRHSPAASRKSSSELYMIGKGYKGLTRK